MLTKDEQILLEENLSADPVQVALRTGNRLVAEQVGVLAKARVKLPSFYDARCYILPISYQQSTSEIVAQSREIPQGELAVDLTCGLGVDCYYLSKKFKRVITCEIDPQRAQIATENFKKLGAHNIEVRCTSAESLLESGELQDVDLLFCDPARRDSAGEKRHALEDCSPNIIELMPQLMSVSKRIAIKLSPLFDVDELFRLFSQNIEVEVISHKNECKEVVLHLGDGIRCGAISHTIISGGGEVRRFSFSREMASRQTLPLETEPRWIYVPDVAFVKSRCLDLYMCDYFPLSAYLNFGFILSSVALEGFAGSGFMISRVEEYKPKILKKLFKSLSITTATVHLRGVPYPVSQIVRQLGLSEGAGCDLFIFRDDRGAVKVAF